MSSIFKFGCTLHCVTVWNTYFVLCTLQYAKSQFACFWLLCGKLLSVYTAYCAVANVNNKLNIFLFINKQTQLHHRPREGIKAGTEKVCHRGKRKCRRIWLVLFIDQPVILHICTNTVQQGYVLQGTVYKRYRQVLY